MLAVIYARDYIFLKKINGTCLSRYMYLQLCFVVVLFERLDAVGGIYHDNQQKYYGDKNPDIELNHCVFGHWGSLQYAQTVELLPTFERTNNKVLTRLNGKTNQYNLCDSEITYKSSNERAFLIGLGAASALSGLILAVTFRFVS
tara:strand:+ start:1525 stop:1959 length:435 start_codon:yes stop_codon:yes gene_type:complete